MTIQQLATSAVAAATKSPDLLKRSLAVINSVRPEHYAVIIGPTARALVTGDQPTASIVVTNDENLEGDYNRTHGKTFEISHLTPQNTGVNVHWYSLSLQEIRKAILNKEDRLYIKPNGLWVN